jgi:hypothetical protein
MFSSEKWEYGGVVEEFVSWCEGEVYVRDMNRWERKVKGWGVSVEMWKGWNKVKSLGEWRFWREMGGFEKGKVFGESEGMEVMMEMMKDEVVWIR